MRLPLKQRLFVSYYVGKARGNATLAARLAGFGSPRMAGPRLMQNDVILEAIEAKVSAVAMEADEVLARLSRQASSDMGDFLAPPHDPDDAPRFDFVKAKRRDQLGNIKTIKRTTKTIHRGDAPPEVEVKVELQVFDPRPALETLAKFHGLTYEPEPEDVKKMSREELERIAKGEGGRRT